MLLNGAVTLSHSCNTPHCLSRVPVLGIFSSALARSLAFQFCSHLLDPLFSVPGQDTLLSFLSQLPLPAGKRELSVAKLTSGVQEARCDKNTGHLGNMAKHKQHKLCMEIPSLEGQARGQNSSHSPGEFPSAQTQTGSTPKSFLDADNSNSALLLMNQDWHSAPCHQRRSSGENQGRQHRHMAMLTW